MTVVNQPANVFDLQLPAIAYHDARDPGEIHRLIRQGRHQAPIAMDPYGPEVLTYESACRAARFPVRHAARDRVGGAGHQLRTCLGQGVPPAHQPRRRRAPPPASPGIARVHPEGRRRDARGVPGRRRALLPGAHLARVELAEALRVITRHMPNLRRSGPAPWRPPTELSSPTTLPVEFEAGR